MASQDVMDCLSLAENAAVQKMLNKQGNPNEKILFSDFVIKINRRDREQTRVMIITDQAIYNVLPNDYGKCKRRIKIESVTAITNSNVSEEFVLHIPDEYDYRFKSSKSDIIAKFCNQAYKNRVAAGAAEGKKIAVTNISQSDLKDLTLTKAQARMQTREERLLRKKQLMAEAHDSDNEQENGDSKQDTTFMPIPNSKTQERVRLEDFELLKVLGRGSFGKVMQVRKKSDGKIYAMKILKKQAIIARNQVEHTRAERKILQSLQHPFLMTLRYAFQSADKLYFVLDYYRGGELFFHLKNQRRFSEEVARIYVAEIALALGHLHALNYVYRDLKPENILLDDDGHVCLTDFGLSKDVEPTDQAHTFCGTPEYLAPEIVAQTGHNKSVDWWSLGILLYELTVGIPPFYSQNVNEMYRKIKHGVLRFPPFLTDECKSLIVGLLHRDPTKRLGAAVPPEEQTEAKKGDVHDILAHPFFEPLDIDALMRKEVNVPYKPKIQGETDTANFDTTFTSEQVVDSVIPDSNLSSTQADAFQGFTFAEQNQALN